MIHICDFRRKLLAIGLRSKLCTAAFAVANRHPCGESPAVSPSVAEDAKGDKERGLLLSVARDDEELADSFYRRRAT